ncbi:PKD domain-containing protein [Halorhabdus amylolytica]|uniref:PKD domain-containing protein n=1 Tax=Halorhabdus amylolytica TaxID=2559573 RepID=UPI00145A11E5|nr:PKD domain-containing protein [Halorhabdus amylolytica]
MSATTGGEADRAQSEIIGIVLLTAVVVLLSVLVGGVILDSIETDEKPVANLDVSIDGNGTTVIAHDGGDRLPKSEVSVVFRSGTSGGQPLSNYTQRRGDTDVIFEPGEVVSGGTPDGETIGVLIVHDPSNAVLYDGLVDVAGNATGNKAPTARMTVTPSVATAGQRVTFDASGSSDPDGSITDYEWDLDGDGIYEHRGVVVDRAFSQAGGRTVRLRVFDERAATATTTESLTVTPASISVTSATLSDDGDGIVVPGDPLTAAVTIETTGIVIDSVTADGSAFGAGTVELTDGDGDGTYDGSVTVGSDSVAGDQGMTVTIRSVDGNTTTVETDELAVDLSPPIVTDTSLADGDRDGFVTTDDQVTVTATVSDDVAGVDTVQADAGSFDAGTVELTDGDGDGTYDGTFSVGGTPEEGAQAVSITATDRVGRGATESTESLIVDTTAPEITTFSVEDESEFWLFGFTEQYQIQWETTDDNLGATTVYVNRSEEVQESYTGSEGDETYENARLFEVSGREHTITIVAVDEAGNRACRSVTDTADGSDPPSSAYASC